LKVVDGDCPQTNTNGLIGGSWGLDRHEYEGIDGGLGKLKQQNTNEIKVLGKAFKSGIPDFLNGWL